MVVQKLYRKKFYIISLFILYVHSYILSSIKTNCFVAYIQLPGCIVFTDYCSCFFHYHTIFSKGL